MVKRKFLDFLMELLFSGFLLQFFVTLRLCGCNNLHVSVVIIAANDPGDRTSLFFVRPHIDTAFETLDRLFGKYIAFSRHEISMSETDSCDAVLGLADNAERLLAEFYWNKNQIKKATVTVVFSSGTL